MTKILIIEDEIPAKKKLKRYITELEAPTQIMAEIDTVDAAVEFLKANQPDLIFSDIELLDGNAFEIYRQVPVSCPIIFTTAYDRFWIDAFEGNGIAYLLKPFSQERFKNAWDKFHLFKNTLSKEQDIIRTLTNLVQQKLSEKTYKKRFTIHTTWGIYFLETKDILFFQANEGVVFGYDTQGQSHFLSESTLKEIEEQLDPMDFFRINRSELIHKPYIERIERYNKNTLAIKLKEYDTYLKTSQSQTHLFRLWVER